MDSLKELIRGTLFDFIPSNVELDKATDDVCDVIYRQMEMIIKSQLEK